MSTADAGLVTRGISLSFPGVVPPGPSAPQTMYQLTQGQTARIEAVCFQVQTVNVVLDFDLQIVLQLTDKDNNILWQGPSPLFNYD